MSIIILDEQLANKIAAGEVIERPASVVKELVENAIDALATEIEVVIEEAGKKLIQVTDNGSGMSREDAVLSLQRHATSKIATTEDLFAIRTLGFRGEALPSVAAVSHFRMITRLAHADIGTEITAHGGIIQDLRDTGCPPGTQIQVAQLFYNTPARLKFLKSEQTESGQIADLLNAFSLCHHTLTFRLAQYGRETLSRPAAARMEAHLGAWLGRDAAEAMIPVELQVPGISIEGFVGKPEVARANRSAQLFFINGRRIVNRTLSHALDYAFEGLLGPKRYPVAAIKITMDPGAVDVNVHPAKAEVRFHNERDIHSAVLHAVKGALAHVSMTRELATWQPSAAAAFPPAQTDLDHRSFSSRGRSRTSPSAAFSPDQTDLDYPQTIAPHSVPAVPGAPPAAVGLRAVGQFHAIYLVAEGRDALLIINQHRAHERIIFERLMKSFTSVMAQRLAIPSTLHLGHRETSVLQDHLENISGCGFDIEPMSGQSFLIRAVPALLGTRDPETVLREILADLETSIAIAPFSCDDPPQRAIQEARHRLMASIACQAALKAGKILTPEEQQHLLEQLQATSQPHLCPHGGQIMMTVSRYEMDRKFVR